MRIILDIMYCLAILAASPVLLLRMVRHGRYRRDWSGRLGKVPVRYGLQPVIWIHGVSLGEIGVARGLVAELHSQVPDFKIVISSTTDTGLAAARRLFAPAHEVFQWPMDFSWAVKRALNRLRPGLVILIEGEIWPNFLAECNRRNIPAVVVNGRMSPNKGYPRYKLLGKYAARLFNRLEAIGVQDQVYADKFIALGMDKDKVQVTGMMKFDSVEVTETLPGQDELARQLGLEDRRGKLLVAGGTGPGEEELLLGAYGTLVKNWPDLRLAIVPRKPERFDEVARLITAAGYPCLRRSAAQWPPAGDTPRPVILGDTMGELRLFYAMADLVFVGRSLVPAGGSDMIEAAALGRATCFGPYTFNFPQAQALARHGCVQVADVDGLVRQLQTWLAEPDQAAAAGTQAQDYVRSQQGATRRNVELICRTLGRVPALTPGDIATEILA
jgi:3-deoxy-D-manno-octulosonic-acid transferase